MQRLEGTSVDIHLAGKLDRCEQSNNALVGGHKTNCIVSITKH